MMGSGTISGPTREGYGSMLELTWGGKNPIKLNDAVQSANSSMIMTL
jgi:fumarylacetoacetase